MSQIAKSDFFPKWWGKVLLQTYDHFFAEFLQELSLVHLSILTPAYLCRFMVRTRQNFPPLKIFLEDCSSPLSQPKSELPLFYWKNPQNKNVNPIIHGDYKPSSLQGKI